MKPIFDARSEWQRVRVQGQRGLLILSLFLGLGVAHADTTNFTEAFGEAFWTMQPQFGSINFSNSDTELVLAGPNVPASQTTSFDGIRYDGPLGGGLVVGGTVSFHWVYNSGDALSDSEAEIAWTPPGSTSTQVLLGQGGPGVNQSGDYSSPLLSQGTTNLTFLLATDTLANKLTGTLIITDFQFHNIPEPSTGTLLASAVILLGAVRWRCGRQWASGPP